MTRIYRRLPLAALLAVHLIYMGAVAASAPAAAMQILEAADHAELAAEISARSVNRIALHGDRIAKVVRSPDGFAVEHDAGSGDLYLRPTNSDVRALDPVTLFIGTEKGFTYRLRLTPADRDSAQILIRNAQAMPADAADGPVASDDPRIGVRGRPRVAALVRLVRAVARREPLPGYAIHAGLAPRLGGPPAPDTDPGDRLPSIRAGGPSLFGFTVIETWRGPRFAAHVLEADRLPSADAYDAWPGPGIQSGAGFRSGPAGLAGTIEGLPGVGRVAAVWLAAPGTGPSGGRLAVAVTEAAATGDPR